jgi:hypothetical protein
MNTNIIRKTKTKSVLKMPKLPVGKSNMVLTKHFTNTQARFQYEEEGAMMSWLVYNCKADNTITYSTHLMNKYRAFIDEIGKEYQVLPPLYVPTLSFCRQAFVKLIESGVLFNTSKPNVFMINPMLCYDPQIISRKRYDAVQDMYQLCADGKISLASFVEYYSRDVAKFLESKKSNYKYNNK